MNFSRFLHENRTLHIDHRLDTRLRGPGAENVAEENTLATTGRAGNRQNKATRAMRIRFRHLKPSFAPSVFADPLPYIEPWERQ